MSTCEGVEKKTPSVPFFHRLRKASYKKNTSLIPPPSGGKWNIHTGDRKERGGREAEKAVCRSPPFRNQIVY